MHMCRTAVTLVTSRRRCFGVGVDVSMVESLTVWSYAEHRPTLERVSNCNNVHNLPRGEHVRT